MKIITNKLPFIVILCLITHYALAQSGTVFRDYNANGTKDTNEPLVSGIFVKAYNASGALCASATSTGTTAPNYTLPTTCTGQVRVEFEIPSTNSGASIASLDYTSYGGSTYGTSVQFVSAGASNINFGVYYPADYCQSNPPIITPCYVESSDSNLDIVVKFSYNNTGIAAMDKTSITNSSQVGSLWGMAFSKTKKTIYTSAVLKTHIPLGAAGLDAIYTIDPFSGVQNATPWLQLTDDLGIAVSSVTANPQYVTNSVRGVNTSPQNDASAFVDAGKVGIGDIELSADEQTLYVVNLFDKKLYAINTSTKALIASYAIPDPGCTNGKARPWAIGEYQGQLFVGVTCDGSASGNPANLSDNAGVGNLKVTVYRLDGSLFTQVLTSPLDYLREPSFQYSGGCDAINHWKPWCDIMPATCTDGNVSYPTPLLTDIEFDDNGNMILGFTDRTGYQFGYENYGPTGTTARSLYAGGDILKACKTSTAWTIESTGAGCTSSEGLAINATDTQGYNTSGGTILSKPGEFYLGDYFHADGNVDNTGMSWYPGHPEITLGGLVVVPGTGEVMSNAYDPVIGEPNYNTGGVITLSNTTGKRTRNGFQLYATAPGGVTAGKGVGFGDLEALCDPAPIEIGNRIWKDTDKDGIQDADELGIDGVAIDLYEGTIKVGTATSANGGQWYFNTTNITGGLKPNTTYTIKVVTALGSGSLATSAAYTIKDATSSGIVDFSDNDASNTGEIALTTGNYGQNNHTFDIGVTEGFCTLSLKPSVSECYQNGGTSKTTISVEVAWGNATISPTANDASDAITVTLAGQTQTINPGTYTSSGGNGTVISPQTVVFELPADASTQTAQAFVGADYASSTCKAEQMGITLPAACPLTECATGQTGGTVWNDYSADGIKQAGETSGVQGVTVKAYDCNGALVGTTTTDVVGNYVFANIAASAYPIRVEFSNLPAQATANGTDGRTTTQFVTAADCSVDLGVLAPSDYCQSNPSIVVPCYVNGDQSGSEDVLVGFPYNTTGAAPSGIVHLAKSSDLGAVWGVAFDKAKKKIYASAFIKRHAGLGAGGIGAIYQIDPTGSTSPSLWLDIETLAGIDAGSIGSNASRGLGVSNAQNVDNEAFGKVGTDGIGDIDISDDGKTLYVMNLFQKKIIAINTDTKAKTAEFTIPDPNCGTKGTFRPFALKVYRGNVYYGVVCSGELGGSNADVKAFIYSVDITLGGSNTSVLTIPMDYTRGQINKSEPHYSQWQPWMNTYNHTLAEQKRYTDFYNISYPSPILSDIEFDENGDMTIALMDRFGHQGGAVNKFPSSGTGIPTASSAVENVQAGGDILKAHLGSTTWTLENNGVSGTNIGSGSPNQGPGGKEFYKDDFDNNGHSETSFGGLAVLKGTSEIVTDVYDPYIVNSGGIKFFNVKNGMPTDSLHLYAGDNTATGGNFAKAIGLGDIEILCNLAPIEIGNRVWNDVNKNGVQDPCEKALKDVMVTLYKGTTQIATTKTNSVGEYYFSSKSKIGTGTWSGIGADTTLIPTTAYKLVFGEGQLTSGKLTIAALGQFDITLKDATANNGNDQNDSDAALVSGAFCINLITGTSGSVNHTFDVGFVCTTPTIGNKIAQTSASCSATTANNNGKISLSGAIAPFDKYRVKIGTAAWIGDSTYTTATTIGNIFPKDLQTGIPNVGATYVIRFYTGECCYKDTTITVAEVTCTGCTPPTLVTAGSNSAVAQGGTINLTSSSTGGTAYLWTGPKGFTSTLQNPTIANATSDMAGTYTVTVTSSGTCTTSATTVVLVSCSTTTYPICVGESYTLSAPSGLTNYQWYIISGGDTVAISGAINQTYIATAIGNYIWKAQDANLCSTNLCCPVQITQATNCCIPPAGVTLSATKATCRGSVVNSDAQLNLAGLLGGDKYSFGTSNTSFSYASAIAYTGTSLTIGNIPNPPASIIYYVRVYNGADTCYTDVQVTLLPTNCNTPCGSPNCLGIAIRKN